MTLGEELQRSLSRGFDLQFVDKRLNFKDRYFPEPPVYWKRVHKAKKDDFQTLWDGHEYRAHVLGEANA
jgi:hypothetical protein